VGGHVSKWERVKLWTGRALAFALVLNVCFAEDAGGYRWLMAFLALWYLSRKLDKLRDELMGRKVGD
jgi:hypothetical protein